MTLLPARIKRDSGRKQAGKRSPAHRAFVRSHACCACGSTVAIECAHVRRGTDGGTSLKPSDMWCVSLCKLCHAKQHEIGEETFERSWGVNLKELARAFLRASPHRHKLTEAEDA